MGSTLRADWNAATPNQLGMFVDCKTDLASRIGLQFPDAFDCDGQRRLGIPLDLDLPELPIVHLAHATFAYHRDKS